MRSSRSASGVRRECRHAPHTPHFSCGKLSKPMACLIGFQPNVSKSWRPMTTRMHQHSAQATPCEPGKRPANMKSALMIVRGQPYRPRAQHSTWKRIVPNRKCTCEADILRTGGGWVKRAHWACVWHFHNPSLWSVVFVWRYRDVIECPKAMYDQQHRHKRVYQIRKR